MAGSRRIFEGSIDTVEGEPFDASHGSEDTFARKAYATPWALVMVAMTVIFLLCAAGNVSSSEKATMASVLTSTDNGKTIDVRVGATVVLRLPENPSTGYGWAVDADPAFVEIGERRYISMSNMVGGGGEAQWSIKATASGTTKIRLKRWREWEGEHSVVERYEVTLAISP